MRVDKLLWYLRLAKTRVLAQAMAEAGHMRLNGRRIDRAHLKVAPGDILTLANAQGIRVISVLTLPTRRGPAPEAQSCYLELDAANSFPLAAGQNNSAAEGDLQP
jgi:ribosome-associated heat shock protein Hsp15